MYHSQQNIRKSDGMFLNFTHVPSALGQILEDQNILKEENIVQYACQELVPP